MKGVEDDIHSQGRNIRDANDPLGLIDLIDQSTVVIFPQNLKKLCKEDTLDPFNNAEGPVREHCHIREQ